MNGDDRKYLAWANTSPIGRPANNGLLIAEVSMYSLCVAPTAKSWHSLVLNGGADDIHMVNIP